MENCTILARVLHFSFLWCRPAANAIPQGSTVCSHAPPLAYRLIRANTVRPYGFACSNRLITKNPSQREGFQSVKKVRLAYCVSCDSTHKIEFAKQIHKFREHGPGHPLLPLCGNSPCVSRNLYKGRKNVPVRARFFFSIRSKAWFRARGCSENVSFSTASNPSQREGFLTIHLAYRTYLPDRCPRHP